MPRHSPSPASALKVLARLEEAYPDAHCALHHETPWQLLVATILSAQCTDVRVNQVTPALFARYPGPQEMAAADPEDVEALIRTTGFFRNKAKSLVGASRMIVADHHGEVPDRMADLVALPGIGRKTANVLLGNAFAIPGMVVDTHVGRIARRLGWTRNHAPEKVEQDLCALLPEARWTQAAHILIFHGRQCCRARIPACSSCPVAEDCPQVGVEKAK